MRKGWVKLGEVRCSGLGKTLPFGAGSWIETIKSGLPREDAMARTEFLESAVGVRGEKKESPLLKLILAFILGFLLLSPAILGIYWEMFWRQ